MCKSDLGGQSIALATTVILPAELPACDLAVLCNTAMILTMLGVDGAQQHITQFLDGPSWGQIPLHELLGLCVGEVLCWGMQLQLMCGAECPLCQRLAKGGKKRQAVLLG